MCVLFSFFKQNWCLAIYHDRFSDFEQELQQITSAPVGAFISSFSTLFSSYFCSFCSLLLKSFFESGSYCRLKLAGRGMVFTSLFLPPSEQTSGCAEAASCPISDLQQKPAAHVSLPGSAVRPQAEGGDARLSARPRPSVWTQTPSLDVFVLVSSRRFNWNQEDELWLERDQSDPGSAGDKSFQEGEGGGWRRRGGGAMSLYSCMLMKLMPVGKITAHTTTYVCTSKQPAG